MAEAFPQPQQEPSEHRTGNVIRRRGGGRHHEKGEKDFVFEYIRRYGNTSKEGGREGQGMSTGRNFERILGFPDTETINALAKKEGIALYEIPDKENPGLSLQWRKDGHWSPVDPRNLKRCFELVKEHQGENDPQDPSGPLPKKLRDKIIETLNKEGEEIREVLYFTSVNTPLDRSPDVGADAFFEIDGQIITLDATEKEDKADEQLRADILISEKDISMANELYLAETAEQKELAKQAYDQQISALAERIVHAYEQRKQKAA